MSSELTKSEIDEIEALIKEVSAERKKYNEYQILQDVIHDCVKEDSESNINVELQAKVYEILLSNSAQSYMELGCNSKTGSITLGLDLTPAELTYEEKENLKEAVQLKLTEKRRNIFKALQELGVEIEENENSLLMQQSGLSLSVKDRVLLDFKRELNEKQELYCGLLEELRDVLENIINLKIETLQETTNGKILLHQLQMDLLCIRAKLLNVHLKKKVCLETPYSLNACKKILEDVLQQQKDLKEDIGQLQELKEKYKQVKCKEYDEILRSYLKYKSNIEKKRLLFNNLNRK